MVTYLLTAEVGSVYPDVERRGLAQQDAESHDKLAQRIEKDVVSLSCFRRFVIIGLPCTRIGAAQLKG